MNKMAKTTTKTTTNNDEDATKDTSVTTWFFNGVASDEDLFGMLK